MGDVHLDGKVLTDWHHAYVENWEEIFSRWSPFRDTVIENSPIQIPITIGHSMNPIINVSSPSVSGKNKCGQEYPLVQSIPTFLIAHFTLPMKASLHDTFFLPKNLVKGILYLNERCIGRYWPKMGPQVTLYVPAVWLRPYPQKNELVVFEADPSPCVRDNNCEIQFVLRPIIDAPTPRQG